MKTIGFIGGGRITGIFLRAFENSGVTFEKVVVSDINPDVLSSLKAKFPYITTVAGESLEAARNDLVFLAVHPPVLIDTATVIKDYVKPETVVMSLAPKHTIARISQAMGGFANIARMNPSASSIVNKGVNPIAYGPGIDAGMKSKLLRLLQVLGSTPEVDEPKLEAYAVVSAMGHTYFFFSFRNLRNWPSVSDWKKMKLSTLFPKWFAVPWTRSTSRDCLTPKWPTWCR